MNSVSHASERELWSRFLDERQLRHTPWRANFVFFDSSLPHAELARRRCEDRQVPSGYDNRLRISIGLPAENLLVRSALANLLV